MYAGSPCGRFFAKVNDMKKYVNFIASFKLILKNQNKALILTESNTGFVDLPGGRVEEHEIKLPIKELFKREIEEELGKDVKYKVLKPAFQYQRYDRFRKKAVLITAYEAEYLSGEIRLSEEHQRQEWINPQEFDFENRSFNNEGERAAFKEYFDKF